MRYFMLIFLLLAVLFAPAELRAAAAANIHTHQGITQAAGRTQVSPYSIFPGQDENTQKTGKRRWHRESGWRGIAAILLAIAAWVFLGVLWITWLPATLAIFTGISGLLHRRRNKVLATLGLAGGAYVLYLWVTVALPAVL